VYRHDGSTPRVLASNEKLLTSMAALDLLGAGYRFRTSVATDGPVRGGVVDGDLWLIGGGDPTLTTTDLAGLAGDLADTGIRRVTGRVVGDTGAFDRGWWAPGWLRGISRNFVARPTALRLTGSSGLEAEAAAAFRAALLSAGIEVTGPSATGEAPDGLKALATDRSAPLGSLLAHQNHESDNLYAELTTKRLGDTAATAGSTASGARVIHAWAGEHGVDAWVRDGSGLSDQDRTSADGLVTLLLAAQRRPWFRVFLRSLPTGGDGTLAGRLTGLPVHAKTGTLFVRPTSTLSGYVTTRNGRTVAFSVLTHELPEATAVGIEDAVVRALAGATIRST
jgi:D-alanyl-D-alanine carboxypeptidase/D-alanyl-D-alanine-endopeptidase (penicillin-binding protein 4)